MKIHIDENILNKEGYTLSDFAMLLFYLKQDKTIEEACDKLWEKGLLVKDIDGFTINKVKFEELQNLMATISSPEDIEKRAERLSPILRNLYPKGKKPGTAYYWPDSKVNIAKKLLGFFKKYGSDYTDEEIIQATKNYVSGFNGDYTYMHLLKYFISKRDKITGEEKSELASYIDNMNSPEVQNDNWLTELK